MSAHRIRLQGPWNVIPPWGSSSDLREERLPASWEELFGDWRGTAVFLRKFNQPTNLLADDRVLIELPEQPAVDVQCELNGITAPPDVNLPFTFDVTSALQLHNCLQITMTFNGDDASTAGLWQPVVLQIVSSPERLPNSV